MRRSETIGLDNCGCAIKLIYEHYVGDKGDQWELSGLEVTKHCEAHDSIKITRLDIEDCLDDPWDI